MARAAMSLALAYAWLCLDCELIMDVRQARTCPQCGGSAWWPIARWLDRERHDEVEWRDVLVVPRHAPEVVHEILPSGDARDLWSPGEVPSEGPRTQRCVTPRGAPVCTCGRFTLDWR